MNDEANEAPAGWYPDGSTVGAERYWDGMAWTAHSRRRANVTAPPPVPAHFHARPRTSRPNHMGLVALVLAILGFFLACSRALFLVGFAYPVIGFGLLVVALTLGIIAACRQGRARWPAVAAIIVAAAGGVVGIALSLVAVALSSGVGYR